MGNDDVMLAGRDDADPGLPGDAVTDRVIGIVAEVLGVPRGRIGPQTAAGDIEGWDSFAHVRIVLAVDAAFGIHLSMEAIEQAGTVAGLVEAVDEARAGAP